MNISVDLSLYPLKDNYVEPIRSFIAALSAIDGVEVQRNRISTQVFGEYDLVMSSIQACMKATFEQEGTFVMVAKILSTDRS